MEKEILPASAPQKPQKKDVKKKKKKNKSILYGTNKKGKHVNGTTNFARIFVMPFFWLLKPFRFYGHKKVQDGACLYVCNHYTLYDFVYSMPTTWEGIHYIAKKENFETPIVRGIFRKIKAISVNRDGNDVRGMLDAFKCLKNNEKVAIFPEGTRNKTDAEMLPFHHGASVIAVKNRVPIVPIMLYKKPRLFRMAHVLVGEPFELSEYYDCQMTPEEIVEADDKIRAVMLDLRNKHTEYLQNKKKGKKA
jgi:1-acyl-sn-glycerol-3-phosphate acyltransferase